MKQNTYESLQVWQKSHKLAIQVYKITKQFPKEESFGITSQLRRAALSVPTNIAEGYARQNQNVFKNFLDIAYGSLIETKYLLSFSREIGYLTDQDFFETNLTCEEVGAILYKFKASVIERRLENHSVI